MIEESLLGLGLPFFPVLYSVPTTVDTIGSLSVSTTVHTWIGTWGITKWVEKERLTLSSPAPLLVHKPPQALPHIPPLAQSRESVITFELALLKQGKSVKQDDLFDDIDAVFIALWSAFHIRNCLQDIEAIYSWNLATFLLGNFPEMS